MRLTSAMRAGLLLAFGALFGCTTSPKPGSNAAKAAVLHGAWRVPNENWLMSHVGPPPGPESIAQRTGVDTVLGLQAKATAARIAEAKATLNLTVFTFARAISPDFESGKFPLTAAFFLRLNDIVERANNKLKAHYRRPHPYEADPRIMRFVDAPAKYSYPSYHAARCVVFWRTLAQLDPRAANASRAIGIQIERDRVFAGEHFPSDIVAGRLEGWYIFSALECDPAFCADLRLLKEKEWTPPPRINTPQEAWRSLQKDLGL